MMKKEAANCETIVLIGSVTGTVTGGGSKNVENFRDVNYGWYIMIHG